MLDHILLFNMLNIGFHINMLNILDHIFYLNMLFQPNILEHMISSKYISTYDFHLNIV